jgi:tRNA-dihydrouridine synthase B
VVRIGGVALRNPLVLASMEEHTDRPCRQLMKEFGAALVISEMVAPDRLLAGDRMAARMLSFGPGERPIAGQLLAGGLEETAAAARLVEERGFDLVDVNLSCPIRRVLARGVGGAWLKEPARVEALFRAVTSAVRVPVTMKFRSGFDDASVNAPEVAQAAAAGGAAAAILHARTVVQAYRGDADWSVIARTKAAVAIPIGGAGGVRTPADAVRMLSETGCDLVLLARGVLGNPWLISRTLALLQGRTLPPPTREERCRVAVRHLQELTRFLSIGRPDQRLIRQALYYGKDLPDFPALRDRLRAARSLPGFFEALKGFFRG